MDIKEWMEHKRLIRNERLSKMMINDAGPIDQILKFDSDLPGSVSYMIIIENSTQNRRFRNWMSIRIISFVLDVGMRIMRFQI